MTLLRKDNYLSFLDIVYTEGRIVMEDIKKEVNATEVENVSGGYAEEEGRSNGLGYCPFTPDRVCTHPEVGRFEPNNERCARTCDERYF